MTTASVLAQSYREDVELSVESRVRIAKWMSVTLLAASLLVALFSLVTMDMMLMIPAGLLAVAGGLGLTFFSFYQALTQSEK